MAQIVFKFKKPLLLLHHLTLPASDVICDGNKQYDV
jgi:hypothetical protein